MTTSYNNGEPDEPDHDDRDGAPTPYADSAQDSRTRRCAMRWDDGTACGGRVWGGACDLCGTPDADDEDDREPTDDELDAVDAECDGNDVPTYAGQDDPPAQVVVPFTEIDPATCAHPAHRYRVSDRSCRDCGKTELPFPACDCAVCGALRIETAAQRHRELHRGWYLTLLRRGMSSYY